MNNDAKYQEALSRAQSNTSTANYVPIFEGFAAKGIPVSEIEPRVNVLTFAAWKAVGRSVKKGEHGVKCVTWVPIKAKDAESGEEVVAGRKCTTTTVFHISQTEPSRTN